MSDDVPTVSTGDGGKRNNNGRNRGGGAGRGRGGNKPNNSSRGGGHHNQRQHATKVDMKKYERMINAAHTNFSDIPCGPNAKECDICCKPNDVFGIGACRHPICVECAIRIRVLGNSKTCPVCRADVETLSFCTTDEDLVNVPLSFKVSGHPDEERFGVRFNNKIAGTKYEKYLAHVCRICKTDDGERLEFPSFMSLRQHMANRHEQSYCHICTDNLNLFSRERKTYTRDQLQRHMKSGDFDDKSFKGHPQCLFCEQKFLDEENRYRHLRKDHFFCQFCESNGTMTNMFFGKHDELKKHYKEHHFICEADECKQMGIAFANKFELDLHRANEHSERRNLIELGFGQRPQPSDSGRPMGRGRGGRGGHNEPAPPVPRERIALVQRQVETNPQSAPSEFTTVRSAQSKSTYLIQRSAFSNTQQDFPSLAGNAPPAPSVRSSDFPRLNKVNKPAAATSAAPAEPVNHFPSLGESSASSSSAPLLRIKVPPLAKKRQPPPAPTPVQKAKPAPPRQSREEDDDFISTRRDVPQAVIKVNNTKLRFDTVDDRVNPVVAKSNIQMIQRTDQRPTSSNSASAPVKGKMDFPALPAASAPLPPANSSWLNSKNSKIKSGVISSVTVPANYSKATKNQGKKKNKVSVPKTEVWSSLGPAMEPVAPSTPVDEWQDVPLSKEAQAEKEKQERKAEWARRKAEIQAKVAAASQEKKEEPVEEVVTEWVPPRTPPPTVVAEPEWEVATSRAYELQKAAEEKKARKANNKKQKEELVKTASAEKTNPTSAPTPAAASVVPVAPVPSKPQQKATRQQPPAAPPQAPAPVPALVPEPPKDTYQEKMDALFNMPKLPSMTSMFSSFSLSGMFGLGSTSQATTPTSSGPPPGLENVVPTPPPGLSVTQPKDISFAAAPMVSHDDVKEKRDRMEALKEKQKVEEAREEDDGWTTTTNKAKNGKKKGKK